MEAQSKKEGEGEVSPMVDALKVLKLDYRLQE